IMSSQLIGVLAASTQGDADAKSLQTGAWVAGNATQYNYLEHSDVLAFAEDMKSCGKDEGCQKGKWEKERYNDESNLNVQEAKNTYGPLRAKEKRLQIAESLDTLMSVHCVTSRCESYKTELLGRSVDSYIHLSKVLDEWAPTLDRLALIGGAAAGKQIDSKVKRPGMPEPAELAQVQKAVDYLAAAKGSSVISTGAENAANAAKLRTQLAAQEIAGGHAFEKHILVQGEFRGLGIRTREQFANHIEDVMTNPSSVRYYKDGRTVYLQENTGTVVFRNPNGGEGTAFQPKNWKEYISTLPAQSVPY
ncbi:hypothetical protein OD766_29525, partial [Pseudomonas aeruginosa]|nr:hypothetical protein [Pseudomonas aeruginosa]MCV4254977.1 hypothetical protein [Pseudomonas aeruginosa]